MKLFDNAFSPFAFKVRAALYEKGIDFEKHELRHHSQREELLRLNPRGEVPALQDGDAVLYDSTIICEYLEEKHPSPFLLPADPARRARCRALEKISDTQLDACVFALSIPTVFRPGLKAEFPQASLKAAETLARHCANLDRELEGKDYFVGEFSRADIAVVPHLGAAAFMGFPVDERHPNLAAWVRRVSERPSVQQATLEMAEAFDKYQSDTDPFFDKERLHWRNDRIEWAVRCGLGGWLLDEIAADRAFFSPVP